MTKLIIPVGGSLAEIEQFIESNFISKEEVIKMVEGLKKQPRSIEYFEELNYRFGYSTALDDLIKELKEIK